MRMSVLKDNTDALKFFSTMKNNNNVYQLAINFDQFPMTVFKEDDVLYICPSSKDFSDSYDAYAIELKNNSYVVKTDLWGALYLKKLSYDHQAVPLARNLEKIPCIDQLLTNRTRSASSLNTLIDSACESRADTPLVPVVDIRQALLKIAIKIAAQGSGSSTLFKVCDDNKIALINIIDSVREQIEKGELKSNESITEAIDEQLKAQRLPELSAVEHISLRHPLRYGLDLLHAALPVTQVTASNSFAK